MVIEDVAVRQGEDAGQRDRGGVQDHHGRAGRRLVGPVHRPTLSIWEEPGIVPIELVGISALGNDRYRVIF
jgi:hypothetical protein